jgi:RNA polymerase sigma-70 factor (ECF subfamily)
MWAMDERDWLAERFEEHRAHLRAVAYRMLGSPSEADDAVQESWIRLSRSGGSGVENLGGWLTTAVARVCLDMLRSRRSRREEPVGVDMPELAANDRDTPGPEQEAVLADSIGPAMLVVLETLAPAERVAFVLHDMFDLPFGQIGPIVGRSPAAARQLASRARRRVRGTTTAPGAEPGRQREVVGAFLAAARGGDLGALVALLDPGVVLRADSAAVRMGATQEVRGAADVAGNFAGRARVARLALVNGATGAVWTQHGQPRVVFTFTIGRGKIATIDLLADPGHIRGLDLVILAA